jgi:hypothetical protein
MAAYIDLNPIRAGLVKKPEDYRWCGLAEAVVGLKEAKAGLSRLMTLGQAPEVAEAFGFAKDVLAPYRALVYGQGGEIREEGGTARRKGMAEADIRRVEASGGALPAVALVRRRASWMSRGLVLGSRVFVQEVYQSVREKIGWRRKERRPVEQDGLCVLRTGVKEAAEGT